MKKKQWVIAGMYLEGNNGGDKSRHVKPPSCPAVHEHETYIAPKKGDGVFHQD